MQGQGEARLRLLGCVGGGDAAHEDSDVATPSPLRMQHLGSAPPATPAQVRTAVGTPRYGEGVQGCIGSGRGVGLLLMGSQGPRLQRCFMRF